MKFYSRRDNFLHKHIFAVSPNMDLSNEKIIKIKMFKCKAMLTLRGLGKKKLRKSADVILEHTPSFQIVAKTSLLLHTRDECCSNQGLSCSNESES